MATATRSVSVAGLAEDYIIQRGTVDGVSRQTLRVYRYWLTHPITDRHQGGIAAHVDGADSLDSLAMSRYFTLLRERNLKPTSVHQCYRTLKAFFKWARDPENSLNKEGPVLPHNPLAGIKIKVPKVLPNVPTDEEVKHVLGVCGESLTGLRNACVVTLMAQAGLRREEVVNLTVEDWQRGDNQNLPGIRVKHGKGDKDRNISCGESVGAYLKRYLARRGQYGRLDRLLVTESGEPLTGRGVAQILHRLSERAGLPRDRWLHPHGLRHWAATSWIRAGMGLVYVQRMLGHENITTTQGYLNLVPSDVARAHIQASAFERFITHRK